ncbi:glutamate synthase [NADH], amyloplastic-like [Penaeus monodon]|uniref:glutamate synthase [NADH], amyloplastic-like n=1 Tax=Penaeus monodon TaxID=6687 RepID=UPI0018A70413|nr:glutamate synthase [NADH], amyloplastic-like [Penaeus monodon]
MVESWEYPEAQGLYDPSYESAACGVGFIVNIEGVASAKIIRDAEKLASRMKHRGACSCDNDTGDGAGLLAAIPHSFYKAILQSEHDVELPEPGRYATGIFFVDKTHHQESEELFADLAASHGLKVREEGDNVRKEGRRGKGEGTWKCSIASRGDKVQEIDALAVNLENSLNLAVASDGIPFNPLSIS